MSAFGDDCHFYYSSASGCEKVGVISLQNVEID